MTRARSIGAVALLLAAPALAQDGTPLPSDPAIYLKTPPKPANVQGSFTVVSLGDLLYNAPQADNGDPDMARVLDIVRAGDVAIANQEGMAFDLATFAGTSFGPGQVYGQPTLARDYKAMGIDMVSTANNHGMDWGGEGQLASIRLLDDVGVAHAGGGRTLAEARGAGYFTTPKGTVGLVAATSTFKPEAMAHDAFQREPARAGNNLLRTRTVNLVTRDDMDRIIRLATDLASPLHPAPPAGAAQVEFGGALYRVSGKRGQHYDMNLFDEAGLLQAVREAKDKAGLVVFTIHAHETPTGVDDDTPEPPDFLIKLFHDTIDAGADVIMGGGPHSLRGIEIYKGKPIFYGLAIFMFKPSILASQETATQNAYPPMPWPEAPDPRPTSPPSWYESMMAVTTFDQGRLAEVRLYPIDLLNTATRRRGVPHLATGNRAREILSTLQRESAPLGTRIMIEGDVGVIRP
ncbi:CapA family protein [Sphingomonas sp. CL5.1]|uniref:CapA family protein n=1 Tax=Sphingomonas sp. CL5.1 TaxID=2653203 RepID=UPI001582C22B|nr:CapA family protein [Sphingomonas sp. CL5.1]QKR99602.1 CapA family protein [Sphingomonas sp. CL5.1]